MWKVESKGERSIYVRLESYRLTLRLGEDEVAMLRLPYEWIEDITLII